jgi:3-hydroxyisobutyrate dehydrogenase
MARNLAFIGLGIMGHSMAGHLLRAGHRLVVHNRTKFKAEPLLAEGAAWADSPKSAAKEADVVFLCLPDTPDVQHVLLGPGGVLEARHAGQIVVDHSTISPSATSEMAQKLSAQKITLLDAPISGGDVGAKNATLSIMVGGEKAAFDNVLSLLQTMGKTITHCGPSGSGQMTKTVNQILVTLTNLAVCEAINFAQRAGLDPKTTIAALSGGAAGSWQFANLGPKMIANDFAPGFTIDLQLKDLRLAIEEANRLGVNLKALPTVIELFKRVQQQGGGKLGTQALFKAVKE